MGVLTAVRLPIAGVPERAATKRRRGLQNECSGSRASLPPRNFLIGLPVPALTRPALTHRATRTTEARSRPCAEPPPPHFTLSTPRRGANCDPLVFLPLGFSMPQRSCAFRFSVAINRRRIERVGPLPGGPVPRLPSVARGPGIEYMDAIHVSRISERSEADIGGSESVDGSRQRGCSMSTAGSLATCSGAIRSWPAPIAVCSIAGLSSGRTWSRSRSCRSSHRPRPLRRCSASDESASITRGKRRNLGAFATRAAAETHQRAVQ